MRAPRGARPLLLTLAGHPRLPRAPDPRRGTHELTASPRTFERFTGRPLGYVGGVPRRAGLHNCERLGLTEPLPGLFLVGDSVFPGQSTLATALSGVKAADHPPESLSPPHANLEICVELVHVRRMSKTSLRRKLAIATWNDPSEGNIYGKLTLDATEAVAYLDHLKRTSGEKVTVTHLIGKCIGEALKKAPTLNGFLRLGSYIPHRTVDIAYLVALEEGANLAKAKVCEVDTKSVADIARELRLLAEKLHKGKDEQFEKSQGLVKSLPTWLLRPLLWFTGLLTSSFGISMPVLGLEAFPFGACIITSVGMFGLDEGYAPPTPFARVPVYVLIGALRDAPAVVDGALTVRKQLTLTATIDHRFIDGFQGGVLAKVVRELFENPWKLDGLTGRPAELGP